MIDVVYDACILFSPALRDLLLDIAAIKLVRPHWSSTIHEEWIRAVLRKRPHVKRESLEETRRKMDAQFRKSLTVGHENIVPNLNLPDLNDRHVLAVAIYTKSSIIVTSNLGDFPAGLLKPYGIEALDPDGFFIQLFDKSPKLFLWAVHAHRGSLTCPAKTPEEYIATLEKQKVPQTVAFLREHLSEI